MVPYILVYMDSDMDDRAIGLYTNFDLADVKQHGQCKITEQSPPMEPCHGTSDCCLDTKCFSTTVCLYGSHVTVGLEVSKSSNRVMNLMP